MENEHEKTRSNKMIRIQRKTQLVCQTPPHTYSKPAKFFPSTFKPTNRTRSFLLIKTEPSTIDQIKSIQIVIDSFLFPGGVNSEIKPKSEKISIVSLTGLSRQRLVREREIEKSREKLLRRMHCRTTELVKHKLVCCFVSG